MQRKTRYARGQLDSKREKRTAVREVNGAPRRKRSGPEAGGCDALGFEGGGGVGQANGEGEELFGRLRS